MPLLRLWGNAFSIWEEKGWTKLIVYPKQLLWAERVYSNRPGDDENRRSDSQQYVLVEQVSIPPFTSPHPSLRIYRQQTLAGRRRPLFPSGMAAVPLLMHLKTTLFYAGMSYWLNSLVHEERKRKIQRKRKGKRWKHKGHWLVRGRGFEGVQEWEQGIGV